MLLNDVFERFAQDSPVPVMVRALLENTLSPQSVDELFENVAERQYTRTLLFSSVVDLMGLVVNRIRPAVNAAIIAPLRRDHRRGDQVGRQQARQPRTGPLCFSGFGFLGPRGCLGYKANRTFCARSIKTPAISTGVNFWNTAHSSSGIAIIIPL